MILLIDTDIFLRAALFPAGEAAAALKKALAAPFRPHVRETILTELRRLLAETVTVLPITEEAGGPLLDDSVNLFLTGDKALAASDDPRILDPGEFLAF